MAVDLMHLEGMALLDHLSVSGVSFVIKLKKGKEAL